jgi:tRNA (guanine37-N1)-methyltransferase
MLGLKVLKNNADEIRRILLKKSLIDLEWKIKTSENHVYLPIKEVPKDKIMAELDGFEVEVVDTDFLIHKKHPKSFKDYLKNSVDSDKVDEIKNSFDIMGDVVVLEIPDEFEAERFLIGDAALKFTKRRSVYRKTSEIKGVIRTRELEHLAGDDVSETVHREFGSRIMLDVRKVYFSPRLATERRRVAEQVKDGELIIDMFAGVGPFPITIAKDHDVKIYAVDINPAAHHYIKRNIEINKLKGEIIPLLGDVKDVLNGLNLNADRIIMNLPGTACDFLLTAINSLKSGGILHYYEFASDYKVPVDRIVEAAHPRKVEILKVRKVKSRSPGVWHMAVDAEIY